MSTHTSTHNVVLIDTGPPGPHSGHKILRVANVEGGSGDYTVTWRPICDLTDQERQRISCSTDYRDAQLSDPACTIDVPCSFYIGDVTCCRTGTCGGPGVVTRYHTGGTDRELIVTIENIPQFASNVTQPPCQLIFHWTLVDNITGDVFDGCCGVVFQWKVITPAPLSVTTVGCNTSLVIDTSQPSGSATTNITISEISGGVGPYEVSWEPLTQSSACAGSFAIAEVSDLEVTVSNYNVPQFTRSQAPCEFPVRWTVRDLGLLNEFGNPIGRVETGICTTYFTYVITNPPDLDVEVVGCGQIISTPSGLPGVHGATHNLQIGDITGGSGNYSVVWDTTPSIMTGTCAGSVTAVVNDLNERLLQVSITDVPQFFNNTSSPCVRAYTATITDNVTDVVTQVQCQVSFVFEPTDAPELTVLLSGCGTTIVADSGTCSGNRSTQATVTITGISGGTGSYSVDWGPVVTPSCSTGSWSHSLTGTGQSAVYTASFTANLASVGTCTITRIITVTDNVTGVVTTVPCVITAQSVRITDCPPLEPLTTGCGTIVTYPNYVGAPGFTPYAMLDVSAVGGSGNYAIAWATVPTAVTGTCYGTQQTIVTDNGTTGKTLRVRLVDIPDDVDNTSAPCVRTYQYTITDTSTGAVINGTCAVTFTITQATQDCALDIEGYTCGTSAVNLTLAAPTTTRTVTINGITGGFSGADYTIEWALSSSCGGRVSFAANGLSTLTTTSGASASAVINFAAPLNQTGSCATEVTATIRSVNPSNPMAIREYCVSPITCSYSLTWNTQQLPNGMINCPSGSATLTRTSNSVSRTYSIGGLTNVTDVSWSLSGCGDLSVSPTSGTGSSFLVTYTATTVGAGVNGSCAPIVTATLTGPGGSTSYVCNDLITYDTRPPAITITSITNCGQTQSTTTAGTTMFGGMTINHTTGSGGPYTYEWTRINQTGDCTNVTFTPLTASTQTIGVSASQTVDGSGTCTATYQARVRDGAGVWSAPVTCNLSYTYDITLDPPGLPSSLGERCAVIIGGYGATVSYSVQFATNGNVFESTSTSPDIIAGNWLGSLPGDSPSNYEIRFTGSATDSIPTAGVWYNLGTTRTFIWSYTLTGTAGGRFIFGSFELRRTTGESIASATVGSVQLGINTECV